MMTPSRKGAIAESAITAEAIRLGIDVYVPRVEGGRYDLILDVGPRLLRAQCKWAGRKGDVVIVRFMTCRLTPAGYVRTTYTGREIDGVAAYCAELNRSFWLPIEEFEGHTHVSLRLRPTRNNQATRVNYADEYDFGAVAQLEERRHGMAEARGSSPLSSTHERPLP
jgi:hypothetical protein